VNVETTIQPLSKLTMILGQLCNNQTTRSHRTGHVTNEEISMERWFGVLICWLLELWWHVTKDRYDRSVRINGLPKGSLM
jgi:hypothetical protein